MSATLDAETLRDRGHLLVQGFFDTPAVNAALESVVAGYGLDPSLKIQPDSPRLPFYCFKLQSDPAVRALVEDERLLQFFHALNGAEGPLDLVCSRVFKQGECSPEHTDFMGQAPEQAYTCWMPLTQVHNLLFIREKDGNRISYLTEPGDVVLFRSGLRHGSVAGSGDQYRISLDTRYVPPWGS